MLAWSDVHPLVTPTKTEISGIPVADTDLFCMIWPDKLLRRVPSTQRKGESSRRRFYGLPSALSIFTLWEESRWFKWLFT